MRQRSSAASQYNTRALEWKRAAFLPPTPLPPTVPATGISSGPRGEKREHLSLASSLGLPG
ncbi:hypothetical protein J6590_044734 [Homalodisca vitripennis]|nr:hypothetical protein J6590_044734 [Homalodisca vitripennis]